MSGSNALPKSWTLATVGEVAESIQYGHTASANDDTTGPRFLRITDIQNGRVDWNTVPSCDIPTNEIGKYRLNSGDIVFARTGATTGKSYLIRDCPVAVFASYLIRLRMKKGVDPAFVQAFFQTVDYWRQIEGGRRGIGQPNVNASVLSTIRLPIAPENEQRRIVAKIEELFSDLDAAVAALERAKANLKRYRAAVLKAAVEGKLTATWRAEHPDVEPADKLLGRILAERRQKWEAAQQAKFAAAGKPPPKNWRSKYVEPKPPETTRLPELPDRWCWATIQHVSFVDVGFAFKSGEFVGEGIRLLRGENMEPGRLRWRDVRYWPKSKLNGFEHLLVAEGEIILAMDRPIVSAGLKIARARASDIPCLLVQRMARIRMVDDRCTGFLHCSMQAQAFITHLLGDQTGTQLPHISGSGIEEFVTPIPPVAEQEEISREIAEKFSQIESAETVIDHGLVRASRLRQSILKHAFEGQLVPQDPQDEPASVLLARIAATQSTNGKSSAVRNRRSGKPAGNVKAVPSTARLRTKGA